MKENNNLEQSRDTASAAERNRTVLYGNIALPYARSIYDMAQENEDFDIWSREMGLLAHIVSEKEVIKLLENPMISRIAIVEFLVKLCKDELSPQVTKFLYVLARNNRIHHLERIALEYERMRRGKSGLVPFKVNTAFLLDEKQLEIIESGLKRRYKKTPEITQVVDKSLKAGAIIESDDTVIDGSLASKVTKIRKTIVKNK